VRLLQVVLVQDGNIGSNQSALHIMATAGAILIWHTRLSSNLSYLTIKLKHKQQPHPVDAIVIHIKL